MSQENDHDFRDQHKILVLEMLTNPCGGLVTKILLHSVTIFDLINVDIFKDFQTIVVLKALSCTAISMTMTFMHSFMK